MCDYVRVLDINHHIIVQINKLYTLDLENQYKNHYEK